METTELLKKTVTISGAETKKTKNGSYMTSLKTEDGEKYQLFHTKKDGSESKAFL